jgi:hypothetical protein
MEIETIPAAVLALSLLGFIIAVGFTTYHFTYNIMNSAEKDFQVRLGKVVRCDLCQHSQHSGC